MNNNIESYTTAQKEAIRHSFAELYPKAIFLGEATTTYNCHAYAWSISEGGNISWMNDPNDDIYMNDGSYVLTNRSDPKAIKVSYSSDDHSADIPFSGSVYFVSKWGSACLMKHTYNDCPYNASDLKYYKLSMEISGETSISLPNVSSSVVKTYTLSNVPSNATVEWLVEGSNSKIISGQGSNSIRLEIKSGICTVNAKVHCNTGLIVKIPFGLNVTASVAPIVTDIEMFKYFQGEGEFTLKAISNNPNGIFEWFVSDNNAELYEIPFPDDATFIEYPNIYKAICFRKPGIYTITVRSSLDGGGYDYLFSKEFNITETPSNF